MTLASVAMTKNTPAVPPMAVMTSSEPFLKPKIVPIMRDSIRPMKKVKARSTGTPAAEFFVFSIAKIKPNAPPRNTIRPNPPVNACVMPVATPSHAPATVGNRLRARSQYVLRSTLFRCTAVLTAP